MIGRRQQTLKRKGGEKGEARKEVKQVEMYDFFNFLMERYQEKQKFFGPVRSFLWPQLDVDIMLPLSSK